ncbi:MAG: hypothetical protein ACKVWR_04860, partial [Acidimicrobiales bacterium]
MAEPSGRRGEPRRGPGPMVVVGLAVAAVGMVTAAVCGTIFGGAFVPAFTTPSFTTPGGETRRLERGVYLVFERSRSALATTVSPEEVSVSSQDGRLLDVDDAELSETLTRGSATYQAVARFETPEEAVYDIDVDAEPPAEIIVARSLEDTVTSEWRWLAGAAAGAALLGLGVVLFVVGLVVRARRRPAPPAAAATRARAARAHHTLPTFAIPLPA